MSWFWRGFQSAIFYYVSCAPCATYAHQRRRAKANRRAKTEKVLSSDAVDQGVYQHPSPFDTNVYWREEMALGPGPPLRRGAKDKSKSDSTRRLHTGGTESSLGGSSQPSADGRTAGRSLDGAPSDVEKKAERSTEPTNTTPALSPTATPETWNYKRYQRPDEVLWGFEGGADNEGHVLSQAAVATLRRSGFEGMSSTYYVSRNPAVNDLHPPVVSTPPTRRSEIRWMLQPPPAAKVMAGKIPAPTYSRGVSHVGRASSSIVRTDSARASLRANPRRSGDLLARIDSAPTPSRRATPQSRRGVVRRVRSSGNTRGADADDEFEDPKRTPARRKRPPPLWLTDARSHRMSGGGSNSSVAGGGVGGAGPAGVGGAGGSAGSRRSRRLRAGLEPVETSLKRTNSVELGTPPSRSAPLLQRMATPSPSVSPSQPSSPTSLHPQQHRATSVEVPPLTPSTDPLSELQPKASSPGKVPQPAIIVDGADSTAV